jgi:hypothetical protein
MQKNDTTPNTWFHYDHPEHGKMEVSAHVDKKGKATVKGVGAGGGDPHIHPKHDAGLSDDHIQGMASHASKLGPGRHIMKSEAEVAVAILDKVKEIAKRATLLKEERNTAHVVEPGAAAAKAAENEDDTTEKRLSENDAEDSETDEVSSDYDKDAKRKKEENKTRKYKDKHQQHKEIKAAETGGFEKSESLKLKTFLEGRRNKKNV